MAEWLRLTEAAELTIYTRDASPHAFTGVPERARVVERPLPAGQGAVAEIRRLWRSPREGRKLAREVDAAGHDVVFAFASVLTQAIDVLPFLRAPALYYAPEPLRSAYQPKELVSTAPGWPGAITRAGVNPIERRRKALDRRYIRAARNIVTHSHFTRRTLEQTYGVDSTVVPLGVNSGRFFPGSGQRERFVLSVGALHPLKGHDKVIAAVATMLDRPRVVLIADRGEYEIRLRQQAAAAGVDLEIHSRLPLDEVIDLYRRAAAVVCAAVREPFGLVPLEAMACATPVVAVRDGGFTETIRDAETGLLVERDAAALGAGLSRVLGDPELAARLGRAGRAAVECDWAWERTASSYDALLRNLIATRVSGQHSS